MEIELADAVASVRDTLMAAAARGAGHLRERGRVQWLWSLCRLPRATQIHELGRSVDVWGASTADGAHLAVVREPAFPASARL